MDSRGVPFLLSVYCGVLILLAAGIGFGVTKVVGAAANLSQRSTPEKTLLDERIFSARSIKEALAKPVPSAEPLPAITARLASKERSQEKVAQARQSKVRKLSNQARNALASARQPSTPTPAPTMSASYDRHTVQ
jgi:hypothetical protein